MAVSVWMFCKRLSRASLLGIHGTVWSSKEEKAAYLLSCQKIILLLSTHPPFSVDQELGPAHHMGGKFHLGRPRGSPYPAPEFGWVRVSWRAPSEPHGSQILAHVGPQAPGPVQPFKVLEP